jgi:hypothetical protein
VDDLFEDPDFQRFQRAWRSVAIERSSTYSLFTFGESELPYFLVLRPARDDDPVTVARGEVKIARPLIITPDNAAPEFRDFFESDEDAGLVERFLMARAARFSHLKFSNRRGEARIVTDCVEEAVDKLRQRLDSEEDERTGILVAPRGLSGFVVFRYAAERVIASAPDNIQELRERGFLPG